MLDEFAFLKDQNLIKEIVVDNSIDFANQIDNDIKPLKKKLYPPKIEGVDQKLKDVVYQNAHKIYGQTLPEIIEQRIKKELDSIINNNYAIIY